MDLVPLPWTWGAAVELFWCAPRVGQLRPLAKLLNKLPSLPLQKTLMASVQQLAATLQDLGNQRVSLRNGCLILGCACTRVSSSSSTAYIRHAQRCLELYPSRGAPCSQPFSGRPSHRRQDTLINSVFCSTLHGELHAASLLPEGLAFLTWQVRAACNVELIRRLVMPAQDLHTRISFQHLRTMSSLLAMCYCGVSEAVEFGPPMPDQRAFARNLLWFRCQVGFGGNFLVPLNGPER